MPFKTLTLPLFLRRLRAEANKRRFTWLIGAGISVSSGIPLASDISRRIILLEYLMDAVDKGLPNPVPNVPDDLLTYNPPALNAYFDWYDDHGKADIYKQAAFDWLKSIAGFEDTDFDNPNTYQQLFSHFFQLQSTHHYFLTTLVGRRHGVNLAHLCLAGLLRDHPEWGHTVFTTNFDDLLLQATHSLGYTARIFGDFKIQPADRPSLSPTYPQIVHLHGRHTSYRLINTQEQLQIEDPGMKRSFEDHIRSSHLIVLGYSGWNDLVINILKEQPDLMENGNIFWIPYKTMDSIRPEVRDFLNSFPPGKVNMVVDEEQPLNADSFMLAMCQTINEKFRGFLPYRKGILDNAAKQHKFTLTQLKEYPEHDPLQTYDLATKAQSDISNGKLDNAKRKLAQASELADNAPDIPTIVKGKAYIEIGSGYIMLRRFIEAETSLIKAKQIWQAQGYNAVTNRHRIKLFCLLGEMYYRNANIPSALENLNIARAIAKNSGETEYIGYAHRLFAEISLRQGKMGAAKESIEQSLALFEKTHDNYGMALYHRIKGDILCVEGNDKDAETCYQKAKSMFSDLGDDMGLANTFLALGSMFVWQEKFQAAHDLLEQAEVIYQNRNNEIGLANLLSVKGSLLARQENKKNAVEKYKQASSLYEHLSAWHGFETAQTELLLLERNQLDTEEVKERISKLNEINNGTFNQYALDQRKNLSTNNKAHRDPVIGDIVVNHEGEARSE